MGKLDGQTVIVTGASRGIGAEIAKALAAEGGKIVCVARTLHPGTHDMANYMKDQGREGEIGTPFPGSLEETVSQIKEAGGDATALAVDISTEAECERLVNEALDIYGPIDVLVNNAALAVFMPVQEMPLASWEQTFQIIVHSPFMLSKLVLPNMVSRKHGAIVNVSSSGAVGPGRAPRRMALTPVRAKPSSNVRLASSNTCFTRSAVRCSLKPSSGASIIASPMLIISVRRASTAAQT